MIDGIDVYYVLCFIVGAGLMVWGTASGRRQQRRGVETANVLPRGVLPIVVGGMLIGLAFWQLVWP